MGLTAAGARHEGAIHRLVASVHADLFQPLARAAWQRHAMVQRALDMEDVWEALPEEEAARASENPDYVRLRHAAPRQPLAPRFLATYARLAEASTEARLQCSAGMAALRLCVEAARTAWAEGQAPAHETKEAEEERRRRAVLQQARARAAEARAHLETALLELEKAAAATDAHAGKDSHGEHDAGGGHTASAPNAAASAASTPAAENAVPLADAADSAEDVAAQRAQPMATFEARAAAREERKQRKQHRAATKEEQVAAFRAAQEERARERARREAEEAARRSAAQQTQQLMGELRSVLHQLPPRPGAV